VNDIKRIQGLISRLALKKGLSYDDLRRDKDRARKTMKQLKNSKAIEEKSVKTGTIGGQATGSIGAAGTGMASDSPANILLFSNMKKGTGMTTSLGQTTSSNNNYVNTILPLKQILRQCCVTTFDIATDTEQKPVNKIDASKLKSSVGLQTKIQILLEQRKPPTEDVASLADLYDDDLNLRKKDETEN
jgi:hypothetical protein